MSLVHSFWLQWCVVLICLGMVIVMSQEASVPGEKEQQLQESAERHKRSGDLMGFIGNTIQSKISGFASASGGLSSLSAASKHEYGPPVSYECTKRAFRFRKISTRAAITTFRTKLANLPIKIVLHAQESQQNKNWLVKAQLPFKSLCFILCCL
jgi:hypothetical protein